MNTNRGSDQTEMSEYDARAWAALIHREQRSSRRILPSAVRGRLSRMSATAREHLESLPGLEHFERLLVDALGGLTELGSRAAGASLRRGLVLRAYRKRGHLVDSIPDIQQLELRNIDAVMPRLDLVYIAGTFTEGAAAGLAVSGGQITLAGGALLGAGVGAAPGAAVVVAAMAADAAAVLVATQRAVTHVAAYYGYDTDLPEERLFAVGVLGVATASETAKAAAYVELNKIVQGLARRRRSVKSSIACWNSTTSAMPKK